MTNPNEGILLATLGLILLFSFSLTLITVGMVVIRYRPFDTVVKNKNAKSGSLSFVVGRNMIIIGGIFLILSALFIFALNRQR